MPDEMSCGELGDVAAEVALGVLTGRERARAVAHLERCGACRERVLQFTVAGEGLLGLLPGRDPPPGFDAGVLARAGLPGAAPRIRAGNWREGLGRGRAAAGQVAARPVRGWRRGLAVAASAVAAAGAGAVGWGLGQTAPASVQVLRSAALLSPTGQRVGEAFAYPGTPWWLYVQVFDGPGDSVLICQVTAKDGRVSTNLNGSWSTPITMGPSRPAGATGPGRSGWYRSQSRKVTSWTRKAT